jgi:hypothetical protein
VIWVPASQSGFCRITQIANDAANNATSEEKENEFHQSLKDFQEICIETCVGLNLLLVLEQARNYFSQLKGDRQNIQKYSIDRLQAARAIRKSTPLPRLAQRQPRAT